MFYTIEGTLSEDRRLTLSPIAATEGEGVNRLRVAMPQGLTLSSIRVEYEHPTGLARRNRYTSEYVEIGEDAHLTVAIPPSVLSHAGKVYVQMTGQSDGQRWRSLFSSEASFIVSPSIDAGSVPAEESGTLTDAIDAKITDMTAQAATLQSAYETTAAALTAAAEAAAEAFMQNGESAVEAFRADAAEFLTAAQTQVDELCATVDAAPTVGSALPVSSGGVAEAISALDASKAPASQEGKFNPFKESTADLWINYSNGTNVRNTRVHIGDGKGGHSDLTVRAVNTDYLKIDGHAACQIVKDTDIAENIYPYGTVLVVPCALGDVALGDSVFVYCNMDDPTLITFEETDDTEGIPGIWIVIQILTIGSVTVARVQRNG